MRVASGNGPTQREDRTSIAQTNCIEARAGAHGAAACACARRGAAVQPRRLAGAVESVESVGSVGAGRPEGERSQSAGATEVASARGAELTTYHNLGYAVIFDGPRAARSQPASATMARAAKDSRGQGWHSGRACIRVVQGRRRESGAHLWLLRLARRTGRAHARSGRHRHACRIQSGTSCIRRRQPG